MTMTTGGGDKEDTDRVDRISSLPIDIIRRIHLCLPRVDAVRTSVLSQRWRTIWASHPKIYLNEEDFGAEFSVFRDKDEVDFSKYCDGEKEKRKAFLTYLQKSLDIRHKYFEHVDTFFLQMTVENASAESLVKKWIDFALKKKVKTLHISLKSRYGKRFDLCNIAFIAATLVDLRIEYCQISNCSFILPTLSSLCLVDVFIEDNDFKDLLAGCPGIEQLRITLYSKKLPTMVVSNPTLKLFGLYYPSFNGKVLIESKHLESLEFSFSRKFMWDIEITSRTTVRNLRLRGVNDQDRTLTHFINEFPLLEILVISDCSNLQNLYLSQRNLSSFEIYQVDEVEVRIDAPKLKSLEYTGGLTLFPGIEASKGLEFVRFYLNPEMLNDGWYIWLRNILECFAHAKHLSLICQSEQAIIFPDELAEVLLPTINDLKNLEIRIDSFAATSQQILDGFVWILPGLKTLSLTLGSITKVIEFDQSPWYWNASLDNAFEIRERPCVYDCAVDSLFLRMTVEKSSGELLVNKCISFALENKVKMLCLSLKTIYRDCFYLRGVAFCATTLVGLTIFDCEISNCSFMLPALKLLCLLAVCIEDDDFKDLIAGCPRIEQLLYREY
ncbi:hypothetical protein FXO37_21733 [Capsicum annuum]|nr:hypothetical protein FXO37_21733 [Capsicum annuum]